MHQQEYTTTLQSVSTAETRTQQQRNLPIEIFDK